MKFFNCDCLLAMDSLHRKGIQVDAIIVDPPYGTTACKWDTVIPLDEMWKRLENIVKRAGAIVLFGNQPFTSRLIVSNEQWFKYAWTWVKSGKTNFLNAKRQPLRQTEDILVFSGGTHNYYPQGTFKKNTFTKQGKTETSNYGKNDRTAGGYMQEVSGYPSNVLFFNSESNTGKYHPTQKPVDLMEYLIKTYTRAGETVLDFTMGSGTTGVACANTGRNFIGVELDKHYYKIARERITDAKQVYKEKF